ncbi:hypothetical protein FACS189440_22120 [Bacteroidia bacterium]|nr:hypothetical protein FACS189440_22120 [Bacteroidia bacterium]
MENNSRIKNIIEFIKENPGLSSKEIFEEFQSMAAYATIKRDLAKLVMDKFIVAQGQGKASRYSVPSKLFLLVDLDEYFEKDADNRQAQEGYDFDLITGILSNTSLLKQKELAHLNTLQTQFSKNISGLPEYPFLARQLSSPKVTSKCQCK